MTHDSDFVARCRRFWSNVLAVAYKERVVLRHDFAVISTVLMQPVLMLLLFAYGLSNAPRHVPWVLLDRDATTLSRRLASEIEQTGYFLPPTTVRTYREARRLLRRQQALVAVVIPRDFRRELERGRPTVQVLLDGSEPLTSARLGAIVSQVAAHFTPRREPPARTTRPIPVTRAAPIDLRQRFWFNATLRDRNFFLATLAGTLLTNLCLSVTSLGIVGERENGTYEQMLSLPTSPLEIILGKLLPYVGLSYGVFFLAQVLPGLLFGLWPDGSWLTLIAVTLPFVMASLAIGTFVSTLARSSAQAVFITIFFIMPSFVLSGVMMPYGLMPHGIREVGGLTPLRWYQIALRSIVQRGGGIEEILLPLGALTGLFTLLLLAIRRRMHPRLG